MTNNLLSKGGHPQQLYSVRRTVLLDAPSDGSQGKFQNSGEVGARRGAHEADADGEAAATGGATKEVSACLTLACRTETMMLTIIASCGVKLCRCA